MSPHGSNESVLGQQQNRPPWWWWWWWCLICRLDGCERWGDESGVPPATISQLFLFCLPSSSSSSRSSVCSSEHTTKKGREKPVHIVFVVITKPLANQPTKQCVHTIRRQANTHTQFLLNAQNLYHSLCPLCSFQQKRWWW